MPVFRPRTRLVNFRLSEDEYQALKEICARSGARSVSDYARAAVLGEGPAKANGAQELASVDQEGGWANRWERLEDCVFQIEEKINSLSQAFEQLQLPSPEVLKENITIHG